MKFIITTNFEVGRKFIIANDYYRSSDAFHNLSIDQIVIVLYRIEMNDFNSW